MFCFVQFLLHFSSSVAHSSRHACIQRSNVSGASNSGIVCMSHGIVREPGLGSSP